MRRLLVLHPIFLAIVAFAACDSTKRYPLQGQVLAVDREKQELTVKHEDIPGFMPGMTMPFKVSDPRFLDERKPGDLIKATLAVSDSLGRLENVVKVGEAPLPPGSEAGKSIPVIATGATPPDVELIDQDGQRRRLSDWRGRTVAVTFVYTRCPLPDFCPLMDRNFAAVQRALLQDAATAGRMHLLSVSFDPDHDTPKVLTAHASKVGADHRVWTWLTGAPAELETFTRAFGVSIFREDRAGQEIIHNLRTAVLDADGRVARIFNGNEWKPEELLAAMREADAK